MRFRPRAFCRRIKARRSKKGSHIESRRWRDGGSRANRVAGGFSPPAPTTPRVRVRTGLFLRMGKGHRKMTTSHAGYGTSRQDRFIRSGAIRPLRSGRLAHTLGFIFTRTAPTAPVSAPPPAPSPPSESPPPRTETRSSPCCPRCTAGSVHPASRFRVALPPFNRIANGSNPVSHIQRRCFARQQVIAQGA